ncbi:CAAX prenyl protease KNAG_0J00310 [Huiozyma naganishii CBS 8797]|uniref:intramembrane prenyl-peptidase Rce1 n=1 Tax=Huiozyma naganishii (strain ATCC MYA-139 / BCRC 22969 / CBS 8797 / KCTC 17520 / NBRC 10181 / NCYC 3082 / Yp74L-3) TaxID=1071383 RepID=J7S9H5_HUIN7|nr:hypothetical protein KNAG_0J00310 [Kazachstania naganishii CBS 8797]CCK72114.1 hypothetical protein KNAG_0J00310 [Kazachstania naganishii CBS 8797]
MLRLCLLLYISVSYVLALYFAPEDVSDYKTKRDDPRVIKARMRQIVKVTILNVVVVPLVISLCSTSGVTFKGAFLDLGILPGHYIARGGQWDLASYVRDIWRCLVLVSLLYVGPLTDAVLCAALTGVPAKQICSDLWGQFNDVWGVRNYLFGPISEELVYTSMLLTTYISLQGPEADPLTLQRLLWQPSVYFGIAHLHHGYEMFASGTLTLWQIGVTVTFQMLYTTVFGALTNYVFLRTGGNLWACIVLHSFCNFMGFPQGSETTFQFTILTPARTKRGAALVSLWNTLYYILLLVGLLLFYFAAGGLVTNEHSLQV